jgi:excisionase family DNA binding protein
MIDPLEDVLSKNDVCSLLGISPGTLQRMCVKREIPFFRLGRKKGIRFRRSELSAWLEARP